MHFEIEDDNISSKQPKKNEYAHILTPRSVREREV